MFENHTIEKLDEKIKIMYLNGIATMIDIDDEIHNKEREYLSELANGFKLNDSFLYEAINFSKSLNQEKILEIIECIKKENIEIAFLVDMLVIKGIDGKHLENENKLFNVILNKFNLNQDIINDIKTFVNSVQEERLESVDILKNINNSLKYENFEYLLKFYNIL